MFNRVFLTLLLFAAFSLTFAGQNEDSNLSLMKQFYSEVANQGNYDVINKLVSDQFVEHETLPEPNFTPNRDGVKQFFTMMRTAFPDLNFHVEFMFSKDDKVVTYLTMTGTQKGEFMGFPASGKKFNTTGIDIVRFADGKAVEHWGVTDSITMMQQLGAIPQKAGAMSD